MNRIFDYAALTPPVISWSEMYDVIALAFVSSAAELGTLYDPQPTAARQDERDH